MIPTLGRIVHAQKYEGGVKVGEPQGAIVTRVWSAHVVNLHVFVDGAPSEHVTSASLDEGQAIGGWYWTWPPKV